MTLLRVAVPAAICLCLAANAHAQEPCVTRTLRSPQQIIRAYGSNVAVVQGETLCLEPISQDHRLTLRLAERSPKAIRVSLDHRDGRSVLELTNPGPSPLWFSTSTGPHGAQPVRPGRLSRMSWDAWQPGLELFDFSTEAPPCPMRRGEDRIEPDPSEQLTQPRGFWLGISARYSVHHNRQDELGRAFRSNGYSEPGNNQPIIGYAFDLGKGWWRFAADLGCWGPRTYTRVRDGAHYGVSQCFLAAYAGGDVVQYDGLSVFPMLGIAGGDLRVSYDPIDPPMLRDQLMRFPEDTEVRRNLGALAGLIGVEQRVSLGSQTVLLLGARIGYALQFAQGGWVHDDADLPSVEGGPSVDTSGPFLRLGLGFGAQNAWP